MKRSIVLALVVALGLTACAPATTDLDGRWRLVSATDSTGTIALDPSAPVTLEIDGADVSGRAACNSYSGTLGGSLDVLTITDVSQTEMGCDQPIMLVETRYLAALTESETARVDRGLTLTGPNATLTFVAD